MGYNGAMTKVLFFNYEYPPLGGGAANATSYILSEYTKIPDLEVDLVTSSIDPEYHIERVGNNVRVHRVPIGKNKKNLHFQSQKELIVYAWKAYFYAARLARKNKYDLTHSFFSVPCGFLSLIFKYQFSLPYIVSLRGADVPGYSDRFGFIYRILTPLIKSIWKKSEFVIANSKGLKGLALKTKTEKEIGIIYNGVDVDKFRPDAALRSKDEFIITIGASRITHRKGIDYLIRAIKKVSRQHPNVRLKLMGDGNAREEFEELVKQLDLQNNVEFLGRIPREKTPAYYQEAGLFVLPSLNEGMSNAMLEALASGLPLVATDTGGTKELVADGKNGFVVKMKDPDDLAEKIEKIMDDEDLQKSMAEASRQLAENISWEQVAKRYFELYKKVSDE